MCVSMRWVVRFFLVSFTLFLLDDELAVVLSPTHDHKNKAPKKTKQRHADGTHIEREREIEGNVHLGLDDLSHGVKTKRVLGSGNTADRVLTELVLDHVHNLVFM